MFCISMYSEGINTKLYLHYKSDPVYILKLIIFLSWLYIQDLCFVFPCTVKVSIPNYTCTIRPSVHLEIDHFFIMVIYTGLPYVLYLTVQ